MNIRYIPGYLGNETSPTSIFFKKEYGAFIGDDKVPDLVIGNSMGGFYANQVANALNIPSILINPAYDPEVMMLELSVKFNSNHKFNVNDQGVLVFLSKEDEYFSKYWDNFVDLYANKCKIVFLPNGTGHRINQSCYDFIKSHVNQFIEQTLMETI